MLSIQTREKIIEVKHAFNEHFKGAFSELRGLIWIFNADLSSEQIENLLEIFKHALSSSGLKISESEWVRRNSDYFAGNAGRNSVWGEKFKNCDYDFDSLCEYIEDIKIRKEFNFALRNVEVTLRDDVRYKQSEEVLAELYVGILDNLLK